MQTRARCYWSDSLDGCIDDVVCDWEEDARYSGLPVKCGHGGNIVLGRTGLYVVRSLDSTPRSVVCICAADQ